MFECTMEKMASNWTRTLDLLEHSSALLGYQGHQHLHVMKLSHPKNNWEGKKVAQATPNLNTRCSSWGGGELVQFNHKISVSYKMISLISHSHIQEKVRKIWEFVSGYYGNTSHGTMGEGNLVCMQIESERLCVNSTYSACQLASHDGTTIP